MHDNIIMTGGDDFLGYAKDLRKLLMDEWHESIDRDDYETAKDMTELLSDLQELESEMVDDKLLILSNNNGMGNTIKIFEQ